ncbi:MAG: CsbD family protein [Microbacterium sp.]|nr:CsbD family protein [Microbacterium sp.]
MSAEDKIKAAAEKAIGKAKEVVGDVTHNDELAAEGRAEQVKGSARDAVEDVKDAFRK